MLPDSQTQKFPFFRRIPVQQEHKVAEAGGCCSLYMVQIYSFQIAVLDTKPGLLLEVLAGIPFVFLLKGQIKDHTEKGEMLPRKALIIKVNVPSIKCLL